MHRSLLRSGAISLTLFCVASCLPWRYGFSGGGLDPSLRTYAVLPFENKTTTAGIERELAELLSGAMRKLGRREATEGAADILVTGVITKYDLDIPIAFSADRNSASGTRRKLAVTIDISITNQRDGGRPLYERKGVFGEGQYAESAEEEGRKEALNKLVTDIVQGVQSQWQ